MRYPLNPRTLLAVTPALALLALPCAMRPLRAEEQKPAPALAARAREILNARCFKCHGENGVAAKELFVLDRESLVAKKKAVLPKDAAGSELIKQVESGAMPLGGPKLPGEEIQALKDWIAAEAPAWPGPEAKPRTFLPESRLLGLIQADLQKADEVTARNLRYYSIAHLYNNPDLSDEQLEGYRNGLSKLLNSLSWNRIIRKPVAVDPDRTLLRIDLRDYNWAPVTWKRIVAAYPYGVKYRDTETLVNTIAVNSGGDPETFAPYIRADWFVANACVPPLYHQILELPAMLPDLEQKLQVDAKRDLDVQHNVARSGVRQSAVARNNRILERHLSAYGAYWKTYDFAGNQGERNIFGNPLEFKADASLALFNLPNGMQAYMIADGQGKRLDRAPVNILFDRNDPDDPTVHTGRSCMGCHFRGVNGIKDQMRAHLEGLLNPGFDLDRALAIYRPQEELDKLRAEDEARFGAAVEAAGGKLTETFANEPVSALALRYSAALDTNEAAAEAGLPLKEFQDRLRRSQRLTETLGFAQLLDEDPHKGSIKRDVWEESFGTMVRELALGARLRPLVLVAEEPKKPAMPVEMKPAKEEPVRPGMPKAEMPKVGAPMPDMKAPAGNGVTVTLLRIEAPNPEQESLLRKSLLAALARSPQIKVVDANAACALQVLMLAAGPNDVQISVDAPKLKLSEEATGPRADLNSLVLRLVDRVHVHLTGTRLPGLQAEEKPAPGAGKDSGK